MGTKQQKIVRLTLVYKWYNVKHCQTVATITYMSYMQTTGAHKSPSSILKAMYTSQK